MISTTSNIVHAVLEAVGAGRLPPGAKLVEEEIARIFSVSRTVVREALKELALIGIVIQIPARGAFLASPTRKEMEDCFAARRIIEASVVADVTRHCTANDIRSLRRHIEAQRETRVPGRRYEHIKLLGEFHIEIAKLGGNDVLCRILENLTARTGLMGTFYDEDTVGCGIEDHEALVERFVAGDAEGAVQVMINHLQTNFRRLRPPVAQPGRVDLERALLPSLAST
jgi:DNA-binding GntR family transcriptional regulator